MITVVQLSSVIGLYEHGSSNAWTIVRISQNYSSRFATRPARTQGIGQRGKKGAYLVQQSRLGSNLAVLGPKWRNLRPFGGSFTPSWAQRRHWLCSSFWTSTWAEVGAKLRHLGPKLGRSWRGPCWPKLTPSGANVAAMSDRNGAFGRFWAQNVQITTVPCTFWRPALFENATPSWSCTRHYQTDRSVHSYHSLLNYHAVMYQNNVRAIVEHQ